MLAWELVAIQDRVCRLHALSVCARDPLGTLLAASYQCVSGVGLGGDCGPYQAIPRWGNPMLEGSHKERENMQIALLSISMET
jgi:hypothetical protein